ncbi:hypothetical protein C5167_040844 [Papaver somniferum]|uniref:Uncharacterized protein n=1 Tax=Papaver somniferum TaxID=3469 RepID=A0A4Y7IKB6_PAPSO|nr:uncharacterized protein LOC113338764 [Papaver somniferum]RZC47909.1 hypothetical protein C5167_040844 [Papaver somniferum]
MGRRASTKNRPVRAVSENNGDDVLLKDMLLEDQNKIITVDQNGAAETITELTEVAILEDDNPKKQLTEVAVVELDRSMEVVKSTRKSMRLLGAPADDFGTQSGSGTVEVALEGELGSDAIKEQDISRSLQVKKTDSVELERLLKIVQEQQLRIDELAAEKSLSRQDQTSLAEIGHKGKSSKYKTKYEDARKKIRGLEQNQNELTRKFENANSKLEGYQLGQRYIYEIIDKLKDAAYFQSLSIELPSTSKSSRTPKHPVHTKRQSTAPKTRKRKVTDIGKPPAAPKTRATAAKKKRA